MPWQGGWHADVDVDLEAIPIAPIGPAIVKIGLTGLLRGTIDANASGRFGEKAGARVVGGAGWSNGVAALPLHNDAGVLSTAVLTATAAEVGEQLVELVPRLLGVDYVRSAGPASRVLAGLDWYVNELGITIVGPRVPLPAPPSIEVLSWDPKEQRAELAADELVRPGMILTDTRFGIATVRDVEQTFDASGSRATAWCSTKAASRTSAVLRSIIHETVRPVYLRPHAYRVISTGVDGRLFLQAVSLTGGELPPALLAVSVWPGLGGLKCKPLPGTECLVEFVDGDPARPVVVAFDAKFPPLEVTIDALRVAFGLGTLPVVVGSPAFLTWVTQITAAVNALAPGSATLPVPLVSTKTFTD